LSYYQILTPLLSILINVLIFIFILIAIFFVIWYVFKSHSFNKSSYKKASGNSFFKTTFNKGNQGEFFIYKSLEKLRLYKKLMTNLYLPIKDGNTTEIDMIMICNYGIFVIESKNYGGWIFGNDTNRTWTQTLPNGQKNKFYNPIMQNKTHITALKRLLGMDIELFFSYIVFSQRCELENVNITNSNVNISKTNWLYKIINSHIIGLTKIFTDKQVDDLYLKLLIYTNVSHEIKINHIQNIKTKYTI
jgi:hypothetical protein